MRRSVAVWLGLGWIGYALLPWYFETALLAGPAASGLAFGLADRPWLLPLGLLLLLGTIALFLARRNTSFAGAWLIAVGLAGLSWLALESFAITHRGWSFAWLAELFGTVGP